MHAGHQAAIIRIRGGDSTYYNGASIHKADGRLTVRSREISKPRD